MFDFWYVCVKTHMWQAGLGRVTFCGLLGILDPKLLRVLDGDNLDIRI